MDTPSLQPVRSERGVAIVMALLAMMLMSAMIAGFLSTVNADQAASGVERDQTQAYAAAHAGVEKLTADLGQLFSETYSPTAAQVNALAATARQPNLPGVSYVRPNGTSGYNLTYNGFPGPPQVEEATGSDINAGPYQGLKGLITPYYIEVTARTQGNAEVKMRREFQTVAIPVFQFGLFSENDLNFHAGDNFSFGGRVHSNQNIFIAAGGGTTLTIQDRVTAVGQIVRRFFANGRGTEAAGYTGTVRMAKGDGCPAAPAAANAACRTLAMSEGSVTGNIGSAPNPNWASISRGYYNSYLMTSPTGARRLDLPLVGENAEPIDIIRRPPPNVVESPDLASQRFFNLAALRILLSDEAADITNLPGVVGTPVSLETATLPAAYQLPGILPQPLARSFGDITAGDRFALNTPLIGGVILINRQNAAGGWTDITTEILKLGVTGRNLSHNSFNETNPKGGTACNTEPYPDAIIRIQRIREAAGCMTALTLPTLTSFQLRPNTLYDAREALQRDDVDKNTDMVNLGGVMHYVEFDVNNFRRWTLGQLPGSTGVGAQNTTGYVVYFSDRRGNKRVVAGVPQETAELGAEDFINPGTATGTPNNRLDAGENVNGRDADPDSYGRNARILHGTLAHGGTTKWGKDSPITGTNIYTSTVNSAVARANRAVFFRRALKVVNGGLGALPSNGMQGLTIASENPVYVEGNFNACGAARSGDCNSNGFGPTGDAHRSAAVIADAVTLLSRDWNDLNSYEKPHDHSKRKAANTWYRLAIISGKGINFPHPGNGEFANFGSDGGAHNFLRFLEDWNNETVYYRGSLVSLYFSRQAVGTWKCCENVYSPPSRSAFFEDEFLQPTLLPPRTPMFRDVNTLTFRQILRPTQ